jgi:hypothetical protein
LFEPISEADLVDLFQEDKFPLDAAAFIEKLPLRTTDGLIGRQYLEQESNKDSLGSQVCVLGGGGAMFASTMPCSFYSWKFSDTSCVF